MNSPSISLEELDELEEKYFSPAHVIIVKTDENRPIYILQGNKDYQKLDDMHRDLNRLIKELRHAKG